MSEQNKKQGQTFQSPEENRVRERSHAFGISSLYSEVIYCIQVQLHNLMSKSVSTDGLHNPIINGGILFQGVEQNVSCKI